MIDLSKLQRRSKKDDIPGTVVSILLDKCPVCGNYMKQYKACCGSPFGYRGCGCGYKITNVDDRKRSDSGTVEEGGATAGG